MLAAYKELISCSHRAEKAEGQAHDLIIREMELQRGLITPKRNINMFSWQFCFVKVRALTGENWDPVAWNGDI